MTIRSFTLVTLVMVMGSATGCGGMKNFLFGRGARCGLCNRGAVPAPVNPAAPAQPAAPGCGLLPRCGLFGRKPAPTHTPPVACTPPAGYAPLPTRPDVCRDGNTGQGYVGSGCVDGGYSMGMGGDCGCAPGYGAAPSQGGVVDPYLRGGVNNGGYPIDGDYSGGVIQGDGFQPRTYQSNRVDEHGDRIISEEPLPPGARVVD